MRFNGRDSSSIEFPVTKYSMKMTESVSLS